MKRIAILLFVLTALTACGESKDDLRDRIAELENEVAAKNSRIYDLESEMDEIRSEAEQARDMVNDAYMFSYNVYYLNEATDHLDGIIEIADNY